MRFGLRPQLLVMVTLLLGLALVPLFWTATTISRVSIERAEHRAALALSRSTARSLADGTLCQPLGNPVAGTMLIRPGGSRIAEGENVPDAALAVVEAREFEQRVGVRRIIWSSARGNAGMAFVGVVEEKGPMQARTFVGLLALYMGLLGLGLLVAIHLAITMLIVRPLDKLERSARRVAFGARELEVPDLPATELMSLGKSLHTMTEKLLTDESELRSRVDEIHRANERLKQAQERLIRSERLASVGRLAAGLAHEVGNPITAMLGLESLLLEGGLNAEEQHDFLQRIQRETERIHRILRDLLDFARPARVSDPSVQEEPGDVAMSVAETLALLQPQKGFRSVTIQTELPPGLPLVSLSRQKLVQILLNLMLNAVDAMADAGSLGRISISACADVDGVVIAIADNGPGVPDGVVQRLFEPFVTTKDVGKGTGLGLAVCRGLLESTGGSIQLDSSYRDGARFVLRLPRYPGKDES
jgi:two-component system, NtrC family, sensor kinase